MTTHKQYEELKKDPEYIEKERKRINNIMKNRYANDPEYREKVKAQVKTRRDKLKAVKNI